MKDSKLITILSVLSLLICNYSFAESVIPEKLSLNQAVSITLGSNAGIKESENKYLNYESNFRIASLKTNLYGGTSHYLKRDGGNSGSSNLLFSTFEYKNLLGTEFSANMKPFGSGSNTGAVAFSLRHPLTSRKGIFSDKANEYLSAQNDLSVYDKKRYLIRQAATSDVIRAYYRAVLAREEIIVKEKAASIAAELARIMRRRADEGLVVEYEASQAELGAAQSKDKLNLQRQAAKGALENLMVTIGIGIGDTTELIDSVPPNDKELPSLSQALETAFNNRTELTVYDIQLSDLERRVAMANDELRSRLDVVMNFDSNSDSSGLISSSVIRSGDLTAGIEYRIPLDKRSTIEKRENAKRSLNIMEDAKLFEIENISKEVRSAYRGVESAKTSLEIYEENLKVAQDNLDRAQKMLEEDLATTRDVLEAQESLSNVEAGKLSAEVELYLATIDLKYAMGEDISKQFE